MISVILLMFVAGIGLSQAVSDPHQVTLRWLRLGGIIALSLIAVAAVLDIFDDGTRYIVWQQLLIPAAFCAVQLMATQLAKRKWQRAAAAAMFITAAATAAIPLLDLLSIRALTEPVPRATAVALPWAIGIGGGILGGYLMTMLLGHAYLTAGNEMTQSPFRRLVIMLAILLALRTLLSLAFGLFPYWNAEQVARSERLWNTVIITARYLVGIVVPAIFTYMTYDCVQRRANQSATGIMYVAGVLVIIGEGSALALINVTGLVF